MAVLRKLLALLASAGKPDAGQPRGLPADEIRFVMAFAGGADPAGVSAKLRLLTGSDAIVAEPLFLDRTDEADTFLLLRLPGSDLPSARQSDLYAIAYWLKDEFGLVACEPDIAWDLFADPLPPQEGKDPAPFSSGSCWTETPHSADEAWSNAVTKVPQAWKLAPGRGEGILIGQPDTGIARHSELDRAALRLDLAFDTLEGDEDPTDPLDPDTANPGHGTGTASVAVSSSGGRIVGSAPGAKLVPIRCIENVVVFFGAAVARAIGHVHSKGCHVVTMSLGGGPSLAVEEAVWRAVRDHVLVLAAAGNCWPFVVYPARYANVVAVAGTDMNNLPWAGSSKGRSVTVSAPADNVWRAGFDLKSGKKEQVGFGKGTSFAVAASAGIAALWLSHHGRGNLIRQAEKRRVFLQSLFVAALAQTAQVPAGWDHDGMGAGVIDAEKLLLLPPGEIRIEAGMHAGAAAPHEDIISLLEEATGVRPDREALDWREHRSELAALAFGLMKCEAGATAGRAGPQIASERLRFAIRQCGDRALNLLVDGVRAGGGSSSISFSPAPQGDSMDRASNRGEG